jgi:hypothetical protein
MPASIGMCSLLLLHTLLFHHPCRSMKAWLLSMDMSIILVYGSSVLLQR